MSNLSVVATILAAETSYTITQYPEDIVEGYVLFPPIQWDRDTLTLTEAYIVHIKSTSLANLESAITKFLEADSNHPNGYVQANNAYPFWIETSIESKQWNETEFRALIRILARWSL